MPLSDSLCSHTLDLLPDMLVGTEMTSPSSFRIS